MCNDNWGGKFKHVKGVAVENFENKKVMIEGETIVSTSEWFTVEKLDETTFAISEYKHWEQPHSYLLIGTTNALLIDTGLGVESIGKVVRTLTSLPVQVITTHIHWDHIGGHHDFEDIGVFHLEQHWLDDQFPLPLAVVKVNLMKEECEFPNGFNVEKYKIYQKPANLILYDENTINIGEREIKIIHTPGHSPGHISLLDGGRGYLFVGDLIYMGKLDMFYPTTCPDDYIKSVKRLKEYNFNRIFTGHYQMEVPTSLINDVYLALTKLLVEEKRKQGAGVFSFNSFKIHL